MLSVGLPTFWCQQSCALRAEPIHSCCCWSPAVLSEVEPSPPTNEIQMRNPFLYSGGLKMLSPYLHKICWLLELSPTTNAMQK